MKKILKKIPWKEHSQYKIVDLGGIKVRMQKPIQTVKTFAQHLEDVKEEQEAERFKNSMRGYEIRNAKTAE